MRTKLMGAALCAAAFASMAVTPVMAQEIGAEPTFADISLSAGFTPDPYRIVVTAGGTIDAARTQGGECVGKIADAPDIRLDYSADTLPLNFQVLSNADTTLVINDPEGNWYCDDDSGGDENPMLHFDEPISGVYEIWIGTYEDTPVPATVEITETVD